MTLDEIKELFEERASIMEYDANLPRKEAEKLARVDVRKQLDLIRKKENKYEDSCLCQGSQEVDKSNRSKRDSRLFCQIKGNDVLV